MFPSFPIEFALAFGAALPQSALTFVVVLSLTALAVFLLRRMNEYDQAPRQPIEQFDLIAHLHRQYAFSQRTYGPSLSTAAVLAHLRKELLEVEAAPQDVIEWADVLLIAFDGAMRAGFTPVQIAEAVAGKLAINERRDWPDWRTLPPDAHPEHLRDRPSTR